MWDEKGCICMKSVTFAGMTAAGSGNNVRPKKVPKSIVTVISRMTEFLTLYLPMESGGDSCSLPFLAKEDLFSFLKPTVSVKKKKKGGGNRKIPKHTENSMGYILSCCSDTNPRHPDTPASLGMFKEKRINELEHGHGTAEALPALALCLLISSNAHSINPS